MQEEKLAPSAKKALTLMEKSRQTKASHEEGLMLIQEMLTDTFEITSPSGNRKLPSFLLFQAVKSLSEKITLPSFALVSDGAPSDVKQVVTSGVESVIKRAGLTDALESGFGSFERMFTFGDSFIRLGTNAESGFPVQYQNASLRQVYINPEAESMRNPGSANDVEEMMVVYEYKNSEVDKIYPGQKILYGRLPISDLVNDEEENITEVGHYYNKAEKIYAIIIGKEGKVISELRGDDYPFVMNEESYLPMVHLKCFAMPNSFYSKGIGHLVYRLGILRQIMLNKGISEGLKNINPIRILNVPQGKKSTFLSRLREAYEAQKRGLPGVVLNETIPGENSYAELQKFSSDQLTGEWERIFNQLDLTLQRCGLNLDRINDASKPLGVVEIEEERQNEFLGDILSQNASEFRFAVDVAIDFIKKFITPNSKYSALPVRAGEIYNEDGSIFAPRVTLGMVADELRTRNYSAEVNLRSGTVNSRILDRVKRERVMAKLDRESPAYKKLLIEEARADGVELREGEV